MITTISKLHNYNILMNSHVPITQLQQLSIIFSFLSLPIYSLHKAPKQGRLHHMLI